MSAGSAPAEAHSLDSRAENPTRGERGVFEPDTDDSDPEDSGDGEDWSDQQKRVFQRVCTLLRYWEARDYDILWLTFTSSPTSKPAGELAYSHQKLRQRVERGRMARCSGERCPKHDEPTGHRIGHIDELEHLQIRTCEGPQGVIHAFWAWDRSRFRDGSHDRSLYLPQSWLSEQWAAIHGPEVVPEDADPYLGHKEGARRVEALTDAVAPRVVDVRRYGPDATDAEHAPENVAAYAASQYLGDHGEALEHLGWSHGRSLGGPLAETWEQLVATVETLEAAIQNWKRLISGEEVVVKRGPEGDEVGVHSTTVFKPPPSLGYEIEVGEVVAPAEYRREQTTLAYFAPGADRQEWTKLSSDYVTRTESFTSPRLAEGQATLPEFVAGTDRQPGDAAVSEEPPELIEPPEMPVLTPEDDPDDEWFRGRCARCQRMGKCTYEQHPKGGSSAVCASCLRFDDMHKVQRKRHERY
ncbi:MAG: hypothetical protein ABEJ82_02370 [Haloplanus sp.]